MVHYHQVSHNNVSSRTELYPSRKLLVAVGVTGITEVITAQEECFFVTDTDRVPNPTAIAPLNLELRST